MDQPDDWAARVCGQLRPLLRFRGVTYADLARKWGMSRSSVTRRLLKQQPPPNLQQLEIALDAADLDKAEFFRGVDDGFQPELELFHYISSTGKANLFRNFRHRNVDAREPSQRYTQHELRDIADSLETMRWHDPDGALRRALDILRSPQTDPDTQAEAWGVIAILKRLAGSPATAAGSLMAALRLARSPSVKARVLHRSAWLFFEAHRPSAFRAILNAQSIYLSEANFNGYGRTLVDQATFAGIAGDYAQASKLNSLSLNFLASEEKIFRYYAMHGIALAAVFLGDLPTALRNLPRVRDAVPADPPPILGCQFCWLFAELSLKHNRIPEALEHFEKAHSFGTSAKLGSQELVLLNLRTMQTILLAEDAAKVGRTLSLIAQDLGSIERNSKAYSAVSNLLSIASDGRGSQLTKPFLDNVYKVCREGAQTRAAPSLPDS